MDAPQVEVARSLCEDLARIVGVVYVAVERRGGPTIGEAGDRASVLAGAIKTDLGEELVPVTPGLLFRVVYDRRIVGDQFNATVEWAGHTLRRLLDRAARGSPGTMLPPTRGGSGSPSGVSGAAPAQVGVFDGARKRLLS